MLGACSLCAAFPGAASRPLTGSLARSIYYNLETELYKFETSSDSEKMLSRNDLSEFEEKKRT